jgi:hypothetical protein
MKKNTANNSLILNHKSQFLLTLLSRIFDPFIVLPIVIIHAILINPQPVQIRIYELLSVMLTMVVIPILNLLWAIKSKRVKNWDLSDRKERPMALVVIYFLGIINILIIRTFGDQFLMNLLIMFQIWMTGFILVTLFWKISGHAAIMALATGILISLHGFSWWPVLLLVPIISVVRVLRKDHTVGQVIAGALYSWAIIYISNRWI